MTRGKKPARRKHSGWMSSLKSKGPARPTPWWEWVLGIPVLAGIMFLIGLFLWALFLRPETRISIYTARIPVVSRGVDPARQPPGNAYLTVRISEKDAHLYGGAEDVKNVHDGERVEVVYSLSPGKELKIVRWAAIPQPGSTPARGR